MACARPISAPSAVTTELLLMFCALNGATDTPWRTSQRQRPAVTTDLPASDVVPATSSAPGTVLLPGSGGRGRLAPARLLLAGELGDRLHDPVGDHPPGLALGGLPGELRERQRLAEGDPDPPRARPPRADGLHLVRAADGDRDDRAVGGQ